MKSWRPVIAVLAVAALAHYGFLLIRSRREWSLQQENQQLRQQLISVASIQRDLASLRELSRKLNVVLGSPSDLVVGEELTASSPAEDVMTSESLFPLAAPVSGNISQLYDRGGWPAGVDHAGLDLAARAGDPVYAAASGRVLFSDQTRRLGVLVILDHGQALATGYGHLSVAMAEVGDQVTRGQIIGRVAAGYKESGSHLHFSVHQAGVPVDPGPLLQGWPVKENGDS